jgi:nucleoside-diphosphate-sugar epimerase
VDSNSKIYVAGHGGLVGSALLRCLQRKGFDNLLVRSRAELDLASQQQVMRFFQEQQPQQVILAAAKVGGIEANNSYPADFIYQNLMIEANVIEAARQVGVERLLFLGSSCIYPRLAQQPMVEDSLLSGPLEPTNEPYAVAKIAGIKLCESYNRQYGCDFRSVMPTNLYGPGDNFDLNNSHVLPALMRRFHQAKQEGWDRVEVWGTGQVRREFLHVDDMAEACLFVLGLEKGVYDSETDPMCSHLNVGTGEDITICDLARMVREAVGFQGELVFDSSKPDGTPRKLLDVSRLSRLGWEAKIDLRDGIRQTYQWFLDHQHDYRSR